MDPIGAHLKPGLEGLSAVSGDGPSFVSAVTGGVLPGTALGAAYWWRNVREPVRFDRAMSTLAELGCRVFVEIGPNAILQRYVGECLASLSVTGRALPTMRRGDDGLAGIEAGALRIHLVAEPPRRPAPLPPPR